MGWRDLASPRRARWPVTVGALERPRVAGLLSGAGLYTVVAPAGYGKTTALATAWEGRGVWLTLDPDDADPQALAGNLALACAGLPGGAALGDLLDAGASPRQVVSRAADLLDRTGSRLVLDEAVHLNSPALQGLLRDLLAGEVALLSRSPTTLPEVARARAAGRHRALGVAELAFDPGEVSRLFATLGLDLAPGELRDALALTEGWPIALRFLAQAAAQAPGALAGLTLPGGEEVGPLLDALTGELLAELSEPERDLLARGSVFDDLNPALVREVLGSDPALLPRLAAGGILQGGVHDSYHAHPLLRSRLRAGLSEPQQRALAAAGAAHFERAGQGRRALAAHLRAGNPVRAAELLEVRGEGWLALGRLTLVTRSLAALPPAAWTPALHALHGDALRLESRVTEAQAAYRRAGPLRRALGEAALAVDTVQPDFAWEPLRRARALGGGERAEALWAENLLNAGRLDEALQADPELAGSVRYALRRGDLDTALERAHAAARGERGEDRAAGNHREALLLGSLLHAFLGEPAPARARALEGLREGERLQSPFVQSLALSRLGHAAQLEGDPAAAAHYTRALELAGPITGRLRVEALMGLLSLRAAEQPGEARELAAQAEALSGGDRYMALLVRVSLALALLRAGKACAPERERAARLAAEVGDRHSAAVLALADFAAGEAGSAPAAAQAAARYPFLLGRPALLAPSLAVAERAALLARLAQAIPAAQSALRAAATLLGYRDVPTPRDAPGFAAELRVLGRVTVTLHPGGPQEFKRSRARDLLLWLAAAPRGVPRAAAQAGLFPESDQRSAERNLRVTLHALGQALEPGAGGAFLERGEWLRLRETPGLDVDLWTARTLLEQPAGHPGRLEALLRLPADLAPCDLDAVERAAARHRAALLAALVAEAEHALQSGDLPGALRAAARALEHDPAHEAAARLHLRALHRQGGAAGVRQAYARLEAALAELGLSPLPETVSLYRWLRESP